MLSLRLGLIFLYMLIGEWPFFLFFFFFLAASGLSCGTWVTFPRGIWDLISPTRDQIPIPCIARQILKPLDHQGSPSFFLKSCPLVFSLMSVLVYNTLQNDCQFLKHYCMFMVTLPGKNTCFTVTAMPAVQWVLPG